MDTEVKEIHYCEEVNPDINICFVNIHEFIEQYMVGVHVETYESLKNVELDKSFFKKEILSVEEMDFINKFKTLKKQIEWTCGRFAVKTLVISHEVTNFTPYNYDDVTVSYRKEGAPYLKDFPEYRISISHSNEFALAGLCTNPSVTFGLDIEKIIFTDVNPVINVAFSDKEIKNFNDVTHAEIYKDFTLKEAFLKYIKKGFNESLKKIEIVNGKIYWYNELVTNLKIISKVLKSDKYAFSLLYSK
ncbi:MAG: 4'-phosphopantetheinyl transferase superfamily protein [Deltaproteobacteria bacterium]|nr:4'-phosphopantetheinyl transferase superfamily protein [Deltaproteobacteria bacterium]